jgi:hypothetical protein
MVQAIVGPILADGAREKFGNIKETHFNKGLINLSLIVSGPSNTKWGHIIFLGVRYSEFEDGSTGEISIEGKNTWQIMLYGKVESHLNNTGFYIVFVHFLFIFTCDMHLALMNTKAYFI